MAISVFELFKVGLGPSSSHTMGPMRAANLFIELLESSKSIAAVNRVIVELYGSLALTGVGHGTDKAVLLGLEGFSAETIPPELAKSRPSVIASTKSLLLGGNNKIAFDPKKNIVFLRTKSLPLHSNGMIFKAYSDDGLECEATYYSVGGGFVVGADSAERDTLSDDRTQLPFSFGSGKELLKITGDHGLSIANVMFENEKCWRTEKDILNDLDRIWAEMNGCIERGLKGEGVLPGKMKVKKRAASLFRALSTNSEGSLADPLAILDWVNLYALAVNEENASGSRVVTAPTNGAAGIIPAVLRYYLTFRGGDSRGVREFLLTSGAVGILFAKNASISGAEVGCQGEVGVACSMAAAGLAAVLGGTVAQVEQAAEIGMEHNLGLTCDPIGGLVQIPCIERNAMGAVKAINAARIALGGEGEHHVSLDSVIKTMHQTGGDMKKKYKETSRGGLAVNVVEC